MVWGTFEWGGLAESERNPRGSSSLVRLMQVERTAALFRATDRELQGLPPRSSQWIKETVTHFRL